MRILLAYSGGLDTSYLVARFVDEGHEVVACTVDCGGMDDAERASIASRAQLLGASEHRFLDARAELFDRVLRWLIAGNVLRGGVYPLSVGAERGLQAARLVQEVLDGGYDALAHGCTAAGNDQVRFEAAIHVLAPGMKVLAPVRENPLPRAEQLQYLADRGLPAPPAGSTWSVNAGLWGLTIGGGPMLDSVDPLPDDAWQWTRDGADSQLIRIGFDNGIPVSLNGETLSPVMLIDALNQLAGGCGVGRGYHLGDTVLGIKGRIGFEAPAATVLLDAHRELEKLVLTEAQRFWKDQLGEVYGQRLHQGLFHDPLMRDLEALFASSQDRVSGEVTVMLAHGHSTVTGMASFYSLLAASEAQYGERPSEDADPNGPLALARILAEPARLHARAGAGVDVGVDRDSISPALAAEVSA